MLRRLGELSTEVTRAPQESGSDYYWCDRYHSVCVPGGCDSRGYHEETDDMAAEDFDDEQLCAVGMCCAFDWRNDVFIPEVRSVPILFSTSLDVDMMSTCDEQICAARMCCACDWTNDIFIPEVCLVPILFSTFLEVDMQ